MTKTGWGESRTSCAQFLSVSETTLELNWAETRADEGSVSRRTAAAEAAAEIKGRRRPMLLLARDGVSGD